MSYEAVLDAESNYDFTAQIIEYADSNFVGINDTEFFRNYILKQIEDNPTMRTKPYSGLPGTFHVQTSLSTT